MGKFKMRVLYVLLSLLLSGAAAQAKEKATRNVVVTAEEEKVRDSAGYAAIAEIHREMDDDQSGSIDRKETSGFMAEDMHMRSSDRLRRENAFHGNDEAITVDDLWEAWFESEERAWTNEQVLNWVVNVVNLPIYADRIAKLKIDGSILPRLAAHNSSFMSQQLGIKSSVHRQKLRLNALDVVLFGYRDPTNKTKDIALGLLLLLLTSLLIVYARQRKRAVQQVNELNNRLSELKNMETEFEDVQKKWNEERSKVSTADGGVSATQIENLKIQLEEAERRLEQNGACNGTPLALQPLLRKTCEHELAYMEKQRQDCLREMKEAIELVDRLQKKQGSVLSSLKLATGASSASDQVDSKIFALRSRMEKIHALTRDTQERWMQIESLCGFPILYLSETGLTHSSSAQHFYGSRSGSSSVSSHSNGGIPHSASALAGLHQTPSVARPTVQPSAAAVPSPAFPNGTGSAVAAEHRTPPIRMVPTSHGENASLFSDDTESVMSTEKKKRRGIFKMFKKSNSKGSLQNSSFASNASAAS